MKHGRTENNDATSHTLRSQFATVPIIMCKMRAAEFFPSANEPDDIIAAHPPASSACIGRKVNRQSPPHHRALDFPLQHLCNASITSPSSPHRLPNTPSSRPLAPPRAHVAIAGPLPRALRCPPRRGPPLPLPTPCPSGSLNTAAHITSRRFSSPLIGMRSVVPVDGA